MSAQPAPESPLAGAARYVAIIIDGNGRWARARQLSIADGHDAGADNLTARLRDAVELGIEQLTVFSFSTENWLRPAEEVRGLIAVLVRRIAMETPELHRHSVRMRFIGRREGVAPELSETMARAEALTAANRLITLFVAINYGGRAEILDAAGHMRAGIGTEAGTGTEADFRECLYAPDMHDPDLIIRTGGERRLSNFLLWQSAYSELVFSEQLWPDFTRADLERALAEFGARQRRFGGR
jgi:undecaprenyl diphosphate synthase